MQRLREIIALALLVSPSAYALPGELKTKVATVAASGEARVGLDLPSDRVSRTMTTLSGRSPSFWGDRAAVRASVTSAKNDYRNITLTNRFGAPVNLGQTFDKLETSAEVGADLMEGAHSASVSYGQMLSDSPYPFHAWTAGYNYGFFKGATVVGTNYSSSRQSQPVNLAVDPRTFRRVLRPQSMTTQRIELFAEQLLSERWKLHGRVFQGARFEDRPKHYGAELRNGYALSDRWYARLDTGLLRESRNEALKDERGYFSVYWAEAQVTFEPIYDLLLTAALGTTVEREDVPWEDVLRQVGSDNFSLRASYHGGRWTATLAGNTTLTNTNYRSRGIVGEFAWEI